MIDGKVLDYNVGNSKKVSSLGMRKNSLPGGVGSAGFGLVSVSFLDSLDSSTTIAKRGELKFCESSATSPALTLFRCPRSPGQCRHCDDLFV